MVLSSRSSTGPQYSDWQRAGVANSAATGFPAPMTDASDTVWSGHCGSRVQIGSTPSVLARVGDGARGAAMPGIGAVGCGYTCAAKRMRWPLARASTFHTPGSEKTGALT